MRKTRPTLVHPRKDCELVATDRDRYQVRTGVITPLILGDIRKLASLNSHASREFL